MSWINNVLAVDRIVENFTNVKEMYLRNLTNLWR